MPSALILFSGTGSVGEALHGWDVVSLDNGCGHVNQSQLKAIGTTHVTDILTWDYKQYPVGHFDFIWSSPPCKFYSCLLKCFQPNIDHGPSYAKGDVYVKKTLALIAYFKPQAWAIENPLSGALKAREFMQAFQYADVDYCQFAPEWGYQKPTRIWFGGKVDLKNKKCVRNRCKACIRSTLTNRLVHAQQQTQGKNDQMRVSGCALYRVPLLLVHAIISKSSSCY